MQLRDVVVSAATWWPDPPIQLLDVASTLGLAYSDPPSARVVHGRLGEWAVLLSCVNPDDPNQLLVTVSRPESPLTNDVWIGFNVQPPRGRPELRTYDCEFDQRFDLGGPRDHVLSIITPAVRAGFLSARFRTVQFSGRKLSASFNLADDANAPLLASDVRGVTELAGAFAEVPEQDRAARLRRNFAAEPDVGIRAAYLESLLTDHPTSAASGSARLEVAASGDADLGLVVRLIDACADTPAYVETCLRALDSHHEIVQNRALRQLRELPVGSRPLGALVDKVDAVVPELRTLVLWLLVSSVRDQGGTIDPDHQARFGQLQSEYEQWWAQISGER
jgi:hypothetical protein